MWAIVERLKTWFVQNVLSIATIYFAFIYYNLNVCPIPVLHMAYLFILCFYTINIMFLLYFYVNVLLKSTDKWVKVIYTLFYNFVYHVTLYTVSIELIYFRSKINANISIQMYLNIFAFIRITHIYNKQHVFH